MFGPQPNEQVSALADRATTDSETWTGEAAEVRTRHAAELSAEIARLCGQHEDGTTPDSCAWSPTDTTPGEVSDSLTVTVESLDVVPVESRDLLAQQATELAGLVEPVTLPGPIELTPEAAEQARDLLRAEFATAYGLEVARAFHSASSVDARLDAGEERIALLREILTPLDDVPVAAAGYELSSGLSPEDPAFVDKLHDDLVATWQGALGDATGAQWQGWLARGAAHVAKTTP